MERYEDALLIQSDLYYQIILMNMGNYHQTRTLSQHVYIFLLSSWDLWQATSPPPVTFSFLTSRSESNDITFKSFTITVETNNRYITTGTRVKITKFNLTFILGNRHVAGVLIFTNYGNRVARYFTIRFFAVWNFVPRKYTTGSCNLRNVSREY